MIAKDPPAARRRILRGPDGPDRPDGLGSESCGAIQASEQGATMADKSPRQHMSKKAGKSLKEKRAEKHAKADAKKSPEIVPPKKR
jgi:hypothetical protein